MLQIIVFELAFLVGVAGHYASEKWLRILGWVLAAYFIWLGISQPLSF